MRLGLSDHPSFNLKLKEFLEFASQLSAKYVELKLDRQNLLSTLLRRSKNSTITNLLNSYDFKYFLHTPSIDVNLASLNPSIGRASEKITLKTVHFASKVNAELLVSHVGRLSRDHPQSLMKKAFKNAVARLKHIANASKDSGIIFTIENDHKTADYIIAGYPQQILSLVENIDCKLTFDIGHANTLGKIENFLDTLSTYIVNIHLHDNNGVNDEHLPLGEGKIDIAKTLEKIKMSNRSTTLILECHSLQGLRQDYNLLKKLL